MNREDITLAIAIASFLLSLSSWIHTFATQCKKLSLQILRMESKNGVLHVDLLIENRSRLPIAITRVSLIQGAHAFDASPFPILVSSQRTFEPGNPGSVVRKYSDPLPIQLQALGALHCVVSFPNLAEMQEIGPTRLKLTVCTNRGKKVSYVLPLPRD